MVEPSCTQANVCARFYKSTVDTGTLFISKSYAPFIERLAIDCLCIERVFWLLCTTRNPKPIRGLWADPQPRSRPTLASIGIGRGEKTDNVYTIYLATRQRYSEILRISPFIYSWYYVDIVGITLICSKQSHIVKSPLRLFSILQVTTLS